jgi:hypothetical protein
MLPLHNHDSVLDSRSHLIAATTLSLIMVMFLASHISTSIVACEEISIPWVSFLGFQHRYFGMQ